MKRKKRLEKGIESLKKQIVIHEGKLEKAVIEGNEYLEDYYNREILARERTLKQKKDILGKQ